MIKTIELMFDFFESFTSKMTRFLNSRKIIHVMSNKIMLNIDKTIYNEGDFVKIKLDYETLTPKLTMHLAILDPSEKEMFSEDQYINSQKGTYSNVLRFDTKQWKITGRYKVAVWDQEGTRKEVFFQFKAKNP
jgi:hypothetical protein